MNGVVTDAPDEHLLLFVRPKEIAGLIIERLRVLTTDRRPIQDPRILTGAATLQPEILDTDKLREDLSRIDNIDRGTKLTIDIFPTCFFIPEKLAWDVEEIVERHEGSIRQALLEVLRGLRSSTQTQASSALIFEAVTEMGTELFNAALNRMAWMDDYNPPEAYDEIADGLYRDGLDFVAKKYESVLSEIPGLGSACEPELMDALRTEWLQIREEAKQEVHESSRRVHEAQYLTADTPARFQAEATGHASTDGFPKPKEASSEVTPDALDAIAMESPTRIEFEAGLALAEVTLDQDLEEHGPSLEIAQKYVVAATLTLAKCILTPTCAEPYEAIRRAYDFAEWFAGETMQNIWVWLCVFSEMDASGKLEKYNRDGRPEDGPTKGMSESEIREWHACLYEVAHEALDQFVPEFWKERLKYFSGIASGGDGGTSMMSR